MKLVSEGKPPSELNRLMAALYYGGILAIIVLEIAEGVIYSLTD
jgi:hypothetical protein